MPLVSWQPVTQGCLVDAVMVGWGNKRVKLPKWCQFQRQSSFRLDSNVTGNVDLTSTAFRSFDYDSTKYSSKSTLHLCSIEIFSHTSVRPMKESRATEVGCSTAVFVGSQLAILGLIDPSAGLEHFGILSPISWVPVDRPWHRNHDRAHRNLGPSNHRLASCSSDCSRNWWK